MKIITSTITITMTMITRVFFSRQHQIHLKRATGGRERNVGSLISNTGDHNDDDDEEEEEDDDDEGDDEFDDDDDV